MKKRLLLVSMVLVVVGFSSCKSSPKNVEENETEEVMEIEEEYDLEEEIDSVLVSDEEEDI